MIFLSDCCKKKYIRINGDVLNAESEGSAQSHKNCSQPNYNFKMLITPERKVPQRSDTFQNDHNSKGYPSKTLTAAFTMQKSDRGAIGVLVIILFIRLFKFRLNGPTLYSLLCCFALHIYIYSSRLKVVEDKLYESIFTRVFS